MLMSRALSRVSRTVGARSLLYDPMKLQSPSLSSQFHSLARESPNKLVTNDASLLHRSSMNFNAFQRFGFSSSASLETSEKENGQGPAKPSEESKDIARAIPVLNTLLGGVEMRATRAIASPNLLSSPTLCSLLGSSNRNEVFNNGLGSFFHHRQIHNSPTSLKSSTTDANNVPQLTRSFCSGSASPQPEDKKQQTLRPLSPHLSVYQPQLNSTLSITNRISGAFLATMVVYYYLHVKMGSICYSYPSFYQFSFYSAKFSKVLLEISALAIVYHAWYGVRHLLDELPAVIFRRGLRK